MAKKIKLDAADPTPAAIVPDAPRDVAAEQGYQQGILDAQSQQRQDEATRAKQEEFTATARLRNAQAATEQMLREEQGAMSKRPLDATERMRLEELEKLAMQSGNRPPEIMQELAFLRQRSRATATA